MMILFWQESLSFSSWSEVLKQKFSVDFDNALHVLPKLIAMPQNGPKGPQVCLLTSEGVAISMFTGTQKHHIFYYLVMIRPSQLTTEQLVDDWT